MSLKELTKNISASLLIAAALSGCKHDLTGTYSGFGADGSLFAVTLVASNGKLEGRYQHFWVKNKQVNGEDGLIDATEDNGHIIGTLKPAAFLAQVIPLSGSSDGNKLDLSGAASLSSITLHLPKTSDEELHNQLKALEAGAGAAARPS